MILPLFSRSPQDATISALYGAIVAQTRVPCFYCEYGVSDTVNGRLEMILLQVALFLRRATVGEVKIRVLGQAVFDLFCRDMDHSLRESGVSNLAVPGQIRRIGGAFYGWARSYEAVLAADKDDIATAIACNVYGQGQPASPQAARMAAYTRAAALLLARQQGAAFAKGDLRFPAPAGIFAAT